MAKPKLTFKDREGTVYNLLATKMVEPTKDGDFRREVFRRDLKKSLSTEELRYRFARDDGFRGTVPVYVTHSKTRINIGCRLFNGVDAKVLLKWAKGK